MAPVSCRTVHVPRQIPSVSSTADAPAVGAGNGAMQQHHSTVKQAAGNHSRKHPLTGSSKQYSMQHADSRQHHANSRRAQRAAGSSTPAGGSHATADSRHSCTCSSTVWLHPGTSQGNSRQSVAAARMQQQCGWGRAGIPEAAQHLCQHSTEQYSPTHRCTRRSSLGQLELWICMPHMVFQAICKVDRGGVHHPWPHSSRQPAQQQQPHCVAASPANRQPSTASPTLLSSIRAVAVSAAAAGSPTVQHQHQWRGVHTQKHQQQCVRRNVPVSTCANMQGAGHLPR